jgi:mRNA interferase MazF
MLSEPSEDDMTIAELIYEQVKKLPDQAAREVLDFVGYIRERGEWRDLMNAQSASLAPIWDNSEDKVWDNAWARRSAARAFPFTDLSAAKRRPVLALTALDGFGDFIALPVTSRPQAEHGIPLLAADLVRGSLPAPSWVRTDRIVTLNATLIVKTIGQVSARAVDTAVKKFCAGIGYPPPRS